MAGRGRRLGYAERSVPLRRPGAPSSSLGEAPADVQYLMSKINEITGSNIDPLLLNDIEVTFKNLCINEEGLVNTLSNLHCKAKCDSVFGERLVTLLEHIASMEIEKTTVRAEFLKFLQKDYLIKDTLSKEDGAKFINAVLLLGGIYLKVQVQGQPITILGSALLDYLDLLLQGDDDQFKILAKEVFLNGMLMANDPKLEQKFELFKHTIRKTLVNRNLSNYSKCFLLLVIDIMNNDLQQLKGVIRDFYLANLGDDYLEVESASTKSEITNSKPPPLIRKIAETNHLAEHLNHLDVKEDPAASIKSDVDIIRQKMRVQGLIPEKKHVDDRKNRRWQDGEKLSDDDKIWKLSEKNGNVSGHDDRFVRDDDFYGVQLPRSAKPRKIQGRNEAGTRKSLDANWKPEPKNPQETRGENAWD